ncbi:54S ribosomal protein L12, mitochondrial [Elasticomyces elasticus]|uniref:54S ribosomal protein L12, mitochondrial n=1 Tax=Exophiala sideris TaxID=1016849 RepID=A0ABR0J3B4_9EURO|nr:54S ribosomal protein L12, mitochondrial [Elasticomyces elasticus]KAK5026629.1 54S ribosomal protein L12, mitochondrial [Exophiala sideris]KAK5033630.1 54S ribosomal protein L12, mitochondrial [Exophiala sideris]KAK5055453.1 54S ribosomal protein L12, mitochondrial [Exophiala sideris]KAK5176460.1 54S ribosomal protein L12, mitochondrial [Eurotiomycetes sp. CCFEE 6388]
MSAPISSATYRCCQLAARTQKRSLSSQCLRLSSTSSINQARRRNNQSTSRATKRWQSTDTAAAAASPKITGIVDQISQLTLLETADLVASLKSRLNIPDMAFAAPAAAPGAGAGAPAAVEEEEAAPAAAEKTMFAVKLQSFEATSKPKVIKEVKSMLGLSLVDSKKFVESAPKVLKEGVPKEDAEKIVEAMKALGAVVTME